MRLIDADALIESVTGSIRILEAHGIDTLVGRMLITVAENAPTVEPTLYGYDVGKLVLVAEMLKREKITPELLTATITDAKAIADLFIEEMMEKMRESLSNAMKGKGETDEAD